MTIGRLFSRRQYLAASLAASLAAAIGVPGTATAQAALVRQGYQTNLWGMPTYYLLRSGALEKRGIKFEEFAVPSGNLTMQQMVAKQVDLGTYAGPSFILGHDKGGMIGIAVIEHVGKTVRVMARKELNVTRVEQLKGLKVANQTGSSIGNIFVDRIAPTAGLKRGDYQEVRMNVNDMVAAMAAKTVDAMVNVEPYNAIAEADGIAEKEILQLEHDELASCCHDPEAQGDSYLRRSAVRGTEAGHDATLDHNHHFKDGLEQQRGQQGRGETLADHGRYVLSCEIENDDIDEDVDDVRGSCAEPTT